MIDYNERLCINIRTQQVLYINNQTLFMINKRTYEEVHQLQYRHVHPRLRPKQRRSARSRLPLGFQLSYGDAGVVCQLEEQPLKDKVSKYSRILWY